MKTKLTLGGTTSNEVFRAPVSNYSRLDNALYWLGKIEDPDELVAIEMTACIYFMRGYVLEIEALGGSIWMATFPHVFTAGIKRKMAKAEAEIVRRKKAKPARDATIRAQIKLFEQAL